MNANLTILLFLKTTDIMGSEKSFLIMPEKMPKTIMQLLHMHKRKCLPAGRHLSYHVFTILLFESFNDIVYLTSVVAVILCNLHDLVGSISRKIVL